MSVVGPSRCGFFLSRLRFSLLSRITCVTFGGQMSNLLNYIQPRLERKLGSWAHLHKCLQLKLFYESYCIGVMSYDSRSFDLGKIIGVGDKNDNRVQERSILPLLNFFMVIYVNEIEKFSEIDGKYQNTRYIYLKIVIYKLKFGDSEERARNVIQIDIRIKGALLSGRLDPQCYWYDGELLEMAADLASRLLPAFENSKTGLPHPRVNLRDGVPKNSRTDTCLAGAGTLLVEFGVLSRLIGDPVYEMSARRANKVLWNLRNIKTGLFGHIVDVNSGKWLGDVSGVGAGADSFYEYLLKAYILFGDHTDYIMFNETYSLIKQYMRRGRSHCNSGYGDHPLYVNVDMKSGGTHTTWIDSLQAAFAGIQVLAGDIEEAICTHALYYTIWKKYGVLPERFNWQRMSPDVSFYPLRPEFVEATYLLYQATKNPFYLHVGRDILTSLNNLTRVDCGYATIHSVLDMTTEDRMESFFLAETCKYLFLLFDFDNPVNVQSNKWVFSTEGHLIPMAPWLREASNLWDHGPQDNPSKEAIANSSRANCARIDEERTFGLPLKSQYLNQISSSFGVNFQ
ncbi:unnamed protein product, partial [Meganyctiphanes norvegica]